MKHPLIPFGLLIIVALAWFVANHNADQEDLLDNGGIEVDEQSTSARRSQGTRKPHIPSMPQEMRPAPGESNRPAETTFEADSDLIELRGSLVVLGRKGERLESEDGTFTGSVLQGDKVHQFRAVVMKGHWATKTKPGDELILVDPMIGGKKVRSEKEIYNIPTSGIVELVVRQIAGVKLHVVDRLGRQELNNIEIVSMGWGSTSHPGEFAKDALLATDGQSPVEIEGVRYTKHVAIRAKGYAWKSMKLTQNAPEQRTILLDREALLRVSIVGAPIPKNAKLRLSYLKMDEEMARKLDGEQVKGRRKFYGKRYLDMDLKSRSSIDLDGLMPGLVEARVEIGERYSNAVMIGGAYAHLSEGETATVEVSIDTEFLKTDLAPLSGTIEIHKSWSVRSAPRVNFRPLHSETPSGQKEVKATLVPVQGRPNLWTWKAPEVIPGMYEAIIREYEQRSSFEVPKEGKRDLNLVVGEAAIVAVTVLAPDERTSPASASVNWHGKIPEGVYSYSSNHTSRDKESGLFLVKCPEGMTSISAGATGYESVSQVVDARAPKTQLTLVLKATQGFETILRYKSGIVPIDWEFKIDVFKKDGTPPIGGGSMSQGETVTKYYPPGSYTVRFGKLDGYRAIPEQDIEVPPGKIIKLEINLEKEQ